MVENNRTLLSAPAYDSLVLTNTRGPISKYESEPPRTQMRNRAYEQAASSLDYTTKRTYETERRPEIA